MASPDERSRQWDPLESGDLATMLSGFGGPWWVGGGVALDLYAGERSRAHFDVDVWVLRRDGAQLRQPGGLGSAGGNPRRERPESIPSYSQGFDEDRAAYGVWATPHEELQVSWLALLQDVLGECWQSRYCPGVVVPLLDISLEAASGVPIVRPELVLLSKSLRRREVDEQDFRMIIPRLGQARRTYLATLLAQADPNHPWLATLAAEGDRPRGAHHGFFDAFVYEEQNPAVWVSRLQAYADLPRELDARTSAACRPRP